MRFNRLDLNLLIVLDALLTERSITRAAERLHLSQPATSGALARLRDFFGDPLLTQVGRRMVPTPLAESLAGSVREILLQVQAAVETRPQFDPAAAERTFTFIASDYIGTVLLPELARRLCRSAPGIGLDIRPISDGAAEDLDRGEVDFIIVPTICVASQHPTVDLLTESYACVAWAENSLVDEPLDLERYRSLGHVIVRWGAERQATVDQWFLNRQAPARRTEVVTTSFNTIPPFLIGTNRIATVHRRLAELWTRQFPIKMVAAPAELPPVTLALQWNRFQNLDPGITWLRGLLVELAREI